MTTVLASFVQERWQPGNGAPITLVNPATEEPVAETSADGVDRGAALAFARSHGGPALRALGFAARGAALNAVAQALHAHRDELIALSVANNGATRSDAKFDVDGAIGTLGFYADLGATLGDRTTLVDGEAFQLGRSARLYGQHVWVAREGVAVHVNAFNFPAWGLAEKAAVAWLAGVPVLSKPAPSTALTAFRVAEIIVASGALPAGAFSFLAGEPGDLLDHVEADDTIAFTGSSRTGAIVRAHPRIVATGARVNVEADSLNAAILGADVEIGSDLFHLFVGDVVRDLTQKTGQKCTAIRRVLAPRGRLAEVEAGIVERLGVVKVGDPAREDVGMGPVVTAAQLAHVRAGIGELAAAGRVAIGGAAPIDGLGAPPGKGYFVAPTLIVAGDGGPAHRAHHLEVFGPVATLFAYDGSAEGGLALARAAGGGLVTSVYSDDKAFLRATALGLAARHGRVAVVSSKLAGHALPPGLVLPSLVHGGPGRAGGGEELGGARALALYQQRAALQGDRALLDVLR